MEPPTLYQRHLDTLRQSCAMLSSVSGDMLGDETTARSLMDLASRLPGPPLVAEARGPDWSAEGVALLVSSARESLALLSQRGQFSELGERIAAGLLSTLDSLEEALGRQMRGKVRDRVYGLYVIIDPLVTGGRDPLRIAAESLEGGARVLQLRDKARDKGQSLDLAKGIKKLCEDAGALLIINDHADLAAAVDAHGVHVGLDDLPVSQARKILRLHQIVGRSNHLAEEALEAQQEGADYIAVGAMYPTGSKEQPIVGGPELLRRVKANVSPPVVAIGGITAERIAEVVEAGADAVCVISAVGLAESPVDAARNLVDHIARAGGRA